MQVHHLETLLQYIDDRAPIVRNLTDKPTDAANAYDAAELFVTHKREEMAEMEHYHLDQLNDVKRGELN